MRVHAVYRSSAADRRQQYAATERIWAGRSFRFVQEHKELARELGLRCRRRLQWFVARWRLHEDGSHAASGKTADSCDSSLYRLQPLRSNHFAEQAELLWLGQRQSAWGEIAFRDEGKDCWGQRHQTPVRMGSHSVVESRAARRNQRTFGGYKRAARAGCALDGGAVYGSGGR